MGSAPVLTPPRVSTTTPGMQRSAILLAVGLVLAAVLPSSANAPTLLDLPLGDRAAVWNARVCVGEVGWRAPLEACSAMVWVHAKRAKATGVTLATMARRYSRAVRRPPRHRTWVGQLDVTPTPPVAWPPHLDGAWPRYRARFADVLSHVRAILRGEVPDPCPDAMHYGGPMDSTPSRHAEDATCVFEGTRQRFFRREALDGA